MRWSKLKNNIEANFSDKLGKRIQFYIAKYTSDYDSGDLANRAWITIDGKEVANFSSLESFSLHGYVYNSTTPTICVSEKKEYETRTENKLVEKGEFSTYDFGECCFEYLSLSVDQALRHQSPIINMLAILDRRVGKRRLQKLNLENLHPLVRYFLNFRIDVEGIKNSANTR